MTDSLTEYIQSRGGLGLLFVLKGNPQRFTDLNDRLQISTSTLTQRLKEARDIGLVTPEIDENGTSVDDQYRISERGTVVVERCEELGIVHAYLTMLDLQERIEAGKEELLEWYENEEVQRMLATALDQDAYIDAFGEDSRKSEFDISDPGELE